MPFNSGFFLSRYSKVPDEPLHADKQHSSSGSSGSSSESVSESEDSEEERARKLVLLQEQVSFYLTNLRNAWKYSCPVLIVNGA